MSDEYLTDEERQEQQTGKGLRSQLEASLAKNKELSEQLAKFQQAEQARTVAAVWDELKVPEKARVLYQGEQTAEAIKSWFEAAKGFLNIPDSDDTQQNGQEQQLDPAQKELHEQLQAFQQAASQGRDAAPQSFNTAGLEALDGLAKTSPSRNPHALDDALVNLGLKFGLDGPTT